MPPRIPYRLAALKHPIPLTTTRALRNKPPLRPAKEQQQRPETPNPEATPQPDTQKDAADAKPPQPSLSTLLAQTSDADNSLLAPVHIPEDPNAVLKSDHPSRNLLAESGIVVQRQMEMMNVFLGFEQANRYVILDPHGNHIGYMAEHEGGIGRSMTRQLLRTHRAFTTNIFDRHGDEVLRFNRPFSAINSSIKVYDPLETGAQSKVKLATSTELQTSTAAGLVHNLSQLPLEDMRLIGEAQSQWAPMRRKYALFLAHDLPPDAAGEVMSTKTPDNSPTMVQFAYVDEPFLSWEFSLKTASNQLLGSVNRSFRGFAREIFTDTGAYVMRMDSAGLEREGEQQGHISQSQKGERAYAETLGAERSTTGMTLDQRAVMLATAVTVDYDYFSRHSSATGGMMPFMMMGGGGGGEAAAGGAAAGGAVAGAEAGEVGAVVGGAGRAVGGVGSAAGAGEGAIAGAGTMAGYEAMQRGLGRDQPDQQSPVDDASPQAPQDSYGGQAPSDYQTPQSGFGGEDQGQDVWGGDKDPWQEGAGEGSSGGDGEGGGLFNSLWDAFFGD